MSTWTLPAPLLLNPGAKQICLILFVIAIVNIFLFLGLYIAIIIVLMMASGCGEPRWLSDIRDPNLDGGTPSLDLRTASTPRTSRSQVTRARALASTRRTPAPPAAMKTFCRYRAKPRAKPRVNNRRRRRER